MSKNFKDCAEKLRNLVSDIQGAPYPGSLDNELYYIWYEHVQRNAMESFEYLNEHFPNEQDDISKTLKGVM